MRCAQTGGALFALAAAALAAGPAWAAPADAAADSPSLPRRIAELTQAAGERVAEVLTQVAGELRGLGEVAGERAVDWSQLGATALQLAVVIAATVLAFALMNVATRVAYARLGQAAERRGLAGALGLLAGSTLLDAVAIALAWGVGYAVALAALGAAGQIDIVQTLYLNAFLSVELAKVVLRALFAPRHAALRILPFNDATAGYWYRWLGRLVSLLGYGFLVVVPIANANLGATAGRSLQVLIALVALLLAIAVILRGRRSVRAGLQRYTATRGDLLARTAGLIGRIWHVLAIVYVLALFVIWLSRPGEALSYMMLATGKTVGAILLGVLVVAAISRAIAGGVRVPEELRRRLPLLESRLNAFVPNALRLVRSLVFLAVLGAILDSWGVTNLGGWLPSPRGAALVGAVAAAAAVLLIAWLLWLAMSSWVEYRLNPRVGKPAGARERTLLQLLRNALTVVIVAVGAMLALSELGVDIGPLLAGAGVLGLAIGFGAQKMVQDVITGVFIQFENAINEGDVVTVAGVTGVVERLTVRSVGLRDLAGTYHIVPFSAVDTVSNFMRGFAYHIAAIGVAYREDIAEVKAAMQEAFDELRGGELGPEILDELEMQGVTEFADSAITVRARIMTRPGSQWMVGRAYNEAVKRVFDRRGIEIPFPHRTLYWGEDKQGQAPPLKLARPEPSAGAAGGAGRSERAAE